MHTMLVIGIRRSDGREHILDYPGENRGTNLWPVDPNFWEEDEEALDSYVKAFPALVSLNSGSLGLVLFDFKTRHIFSRQCQSDVNSASCTGIYPEEMKHLLGLMDLGWVKSYKVMRRVNDSATSFSFEYKDINQDEIRSIRQYIQAGADASPRILGPAATPKGLARTMIQWDVPEWTVDDGLVDMQDGKGYKVAYDCWNEVLDHLKGNEWVSPIVAKPTGRWGT